MKIIRERQLKEHKELKREFTLIGEEQGNGFSFPCLQDGSPDKNDENYDCWKNNFKTCIERPDLYIDEGVQIIRWTYTEPALGLCSCGNEVELIDEYEGACECSKCGNWYNMFGQQLIDPVWWEE